MSTIDLTQDAAPAPAPIDLTQDEAPKRKAAPAPAEPPKKRRGSKKQTRGDLESRVMSWNGPNVEPLVSPQEKLENAYTSYEEEVRTELAGEEPSLAFARRDWRESESEWVVYESRGKQLPVPGLAISTMSSTLKPVDEGFGKFRSRGGGCDDDPMSAELRAFFADESMTLASLLEKDKFKRMMRLAGGRGYGKYLYEKVMSWVWALLKRKHNPSGPIRHGNQQAFEQERQRFHRQNMAHMKNQRREQIRAEFGDAGAAIFDRNNSHW